MSQFPRALATSHPPVSSFQLAQGAARKLCPRAASALRIVCGRAWVTVGAPDGGTPESSGDHFLDSGDVLQVPAGASVVLEPVLEIDAAATLQFEWFEHPVASSRFALEVALPARDLAFGLMQAGRASWQVLKGLLGYAQGLVSKRYEPLLHRVAPRS